MQLDDIFLDQIVSGDLVHPFYQPKQRPLGHFYTNPRGALFTVRGLLQLISK